MALNSTLLFGMMGEKMSWLTQRQRVVSTNIANADTPGYRTREMNELKFRDTLGAQEVKVRLAQTHGAHYQTSKQEGEYRSHNERRPYETSPAGNGVVLEEQMMKLTQTQADFNLSSGLFKKYHNMYKIALGRSGG